MILWPAITVVVTVAFFPWLAWKYPNHTFLSSSTSPYFLTCLRDPDPHIYGIPSLPSLVFHSKSLNEINQNYENYENKKSTKSLSWSSPFDPVIPVVGKWQPQPLTSSSDKNEIWRNVTIHIHKNHTMDIFSLGSHIQTKWLFSKPSSISLYQFEFKRPPEWKHWWMLSKYMKWVPLLKQHGVEVSIPEQPPTPFQNTPFQIHWECENYRGQFLINPLEAFSFFEENME